MAATLDAVLAAVRRSLAEAGAEDADVRRACWSPACSA